jgi:hypothetical protein
LTGFGIASKIWTDQPISPPPSMTKPFESLQAEEASSLTPIRANTAKTSAFIDSLTSLSIGEIIFVPTSVEDKDGKYKKSNVQQIVAKVNKNLTDRKLRCKMAQKADGTLGVRIESTVRDPEEDSKPKPGRKPGSTVAKRSGRKAPQVEAPIE